MHIGIHEKASFDRLMSSVGQGWSVLRRGLSVLRRWLSVLRNGLSGLRRGWSVLRREFSLLGRGLAWNSKCLKRENLGFVSSRKVLFQRWSVLGKGV